MFLWRDSWGYVSRMPDSWSLYKLQKDSSMMIQSPKVGNFSDVDEWRGWDWVADRSQSVRSATLKTLI